MESDNDAANVKWIDCGVQGKEGVSRAPYPRASVSRSGCDKAHFRVVPMRRIFTLCLALAPLTVALADAPEPSALQAGHLTLPAAELLFREHSREVLAAKRAVEAAEADRTSAAQRPNPTLSTGVASIGPSAWSAPGNFRDKPYDTGVQVSQLFERP